MNKIELTERFLYDELQKSLDFELQKTLNFAENKRSVDYRYEHSVRVANIGKQIAESESLDVERTIIACLLHDIGYSVNLQKSEYHDHGRIGAKIARGFLQSLGYNGDELTEMCYGIAIHVDDKADFDFLRTPLALTVGDADNIDRFDAFRLYEGLEFVDYRNLPLDKQLEYLEERIARLTKGLTMPMGTATAKKLWREKLTYQIEFLNRLKAQVNNSNPKTLL